MTAYTGYLRRVEGQVVGTLVDNFGWTIHLTAAPDPTGGYMLTGTLDDPPPDFWCELIDGERAG